jgi:hypothetical protein
LEFVQLKRLLAVCLVLGILNSVSDNRSQGAVQKPSQLRLIRWAPQYTLRLQIVGYEDRIVAANQQPIDEILTELTVPITIGLPFKRTLRNDKSSFSVSGLVTVTKKRQFAIDIKCAELLESDVMVLDQYGRLVPAITKRSWHSSVVLKIGGVTNLGGMMSTRGRHLPDGSIQRRVSKRSIRGRLDLFKPGAAPFAPTGRSPRALRRDVHNLSDNE